MVGSPCCALCCCKKCVGYRVMFWCVVVMSKNDNDDGWLDCPPWSLTGRTRWVVRWGSVRKWASGSNCGAGPGSWVQVLERPSCGKLGLPSTERVQWPKLTTGGERSALEYVMSFTPGKLTWLWSTVYPVCRDLVYESSWQVWASHLTDRNLPPATMTPLGTTSSRLMIMARGQLI